MNLAIGAVNTEATLGLKESLLWASCASSAGVELVIEWFSMNLFNTTILNLGMQAEIQFKQVILHNINELDKTLQKRM